MGQERFVRPGEGSSLARTAYDRIVPLDHFLPQPSMGILEREALPGPAAGMAHEPLHMPVIPRFTDLIAL